MRLVIKDYLLQLKEKDELDLLLCDLLLQSGYTTDNIPKTGNRQYGVDIQAHNQNELLLCVVKQGNIDRKMWDDGQNSVRQSLNEILDVYLRNLMPIDKKQNIHIAVVTNGVIEETVRQNWNGFIDRNKTWNGKELIIEFWGIDDIVDRVEKHLFNEFLFTPHMQTSLRKALYFVGETDYKNIFFEQIVDAYMNQIQDCLNKKNSTKQVSKQFEKLMYGLYMATQMVAQYAANIKCYKISIMVSEYLIIRYWKFLLTQQLFEKQKYIEWIIKFCKSYEKWCEQYYLTIRDCCENKNAFPYYNIIEQRLLLYEVSGFLASYAYYLFDSNRDKAERTLNTIIHLINNYPQFLYAPYDSHIGVMTMIYRLLKRCNRCNDMKNILNNQALQLMDYYKYYKKYPTPTDSFQDAIDIEMGNTAEGYETSGFWGTVLLWIAVLRDEDLYNRLKKFLDNDLENVTKCIWFLRKDEEEKFYDFYAMNRAGEGIEIKTEKDFNTFAKRIDFILAQYKNEDFSYETYSFPAIEMIVCRYYDYIPRVKLL